MMMIDQMVKYLLKAERKRAAGRRSYSPHSYKLELRQSVSEGFLRNALGEGEMDSL
jgi:hypothetical protein